MAYIVDDLLFAPINGFKFILRTLARVAEEQYTDDAPLKEQLLELQVMLEQGEITEDEYVEREAAILLGLRQIQDRKRELAGAPAEVDAPFTGTVGAGSGASLTFSPEPEGSAAEGAAAPQLEIEMPDFSYGVSTEAAPARPASAAKRSKRAKSAKKSKGPARKRSRNPR